MLIARVVAVASLLVVLASPGRAQGFLFDCAILAHMQLVDPRMQAGPCETVARFTIAMATGAREVRVLRRKPGSTPLDATVERIEVAIRKAERIIASIGELHLMPTTVVLTDLEPPSRDLYFAANVHSIQNRGEQHAECVVKSYKPPSTYPDSSVAMAFAHEIYHCIQGSTWVPAFAERHDGRWWIEGSAQLFGHMAVPDERGWDGHWQEFSDLSPTTSLLDLSHENVVFFSWLVNSFGPAALRTFSAAMPGEPGREAQRAAVASILNDEALVDFARAHLDRRISFPGGFQPAHQPVKGLLLFARDYREIELAGGPLVLARLQIAFGPGYYPTEAVVGHGAYAVRQPDFWNLMPSAVDVPCDSPSVAYQGAGMSTDPAGTEVTFKFKPPEDTCAGCTSADPRVALFMPTGQDACLVGSWEVVSGHDGMVQDRLVYLGAAGDYLSFGGPDSLPEIPVQDAGSIVAEIREDGTLTFWVTNRQRERHYTTRDISLGPQSTVTGTVIDRYHLSRMQTDAHWVAGEGRLWLCHPRDSVTGLLEITHASPEQNWQDRFRLISIGGQIMAQFVHGDGPASIAGGDGFNNQNFPQFRDHSYTCTGDQLVFTGTPDIRISDDKVIPGRPTVVWQRLQ